MIQIGLNLGLAGVLTEFRWGLDTEGKVLK